MAIKLDSEYFEWLINIVSTQGPSRKMYRKLFVFLHRTEFTYTIRMDQNRAIDGENLRRRFALEMDYDEPTTVADLDNPCSVLEMMVALALRCEEQLTVDDYYGDRTSQWFWGMVINLGLGPMTDEMFDVRYVHMIVQRFLERGYEPDGKGGLFRVRNSRIDMRDVEIWRQLHAYLNTVL